MNFKKMSKILLVAAFTVVMATSCSPKEEPKATSKDSTSSTSSAGEDTSASGKIKTFSAFMAVPGTELPDDNRMMNKIAEQIGAKADVTWLTGQSAAERIGIMVAGGEYPDLIDGSDGTKALLDAGDLVPIEGYFDKYTNIKNYLSEKDWNKVRDEDGHIYIIPQFGIVPVKNTKTQHADEAFWVQKRVLIWDNYPTIKTLDQYFDLLNRYLAANPKTEDGQNNIGFEILSDDWRYFCLENPPQFLAGYPNDGCATVDLVTKKASTYDKIPEAKEYFQKINEQYNKGTIDPESFTLSYDQYIAKLSSGRVLGMVDQNWDFLTAEDSLKSQGLDDRTYVALDLVLDEKVTPKWFSPTALNPSNGLGVTVSCKDVEGALKFIDDMLSPEVMLMRNWGEEGVDYSVNAEGLYTRSEEQRKNQLDTDWFNNNFVGKGYSYFPGFEGMMPDGKNAILPKEQPAEYRATLTETDKKVLDGYGYEKWTDFLTLVEKNQVWFPLYSATNEWTADTAHGIAKQKMADVKHQYLPKVIMAKEADFETAWQEYMTAYDANVDYKAYEDELTKEVARRIALDAAN